MRGEGLAWGLAALALLLAPLFWSGNAALALLTQAAIAALACLSYNLLFGQGGMLSFGHAVYTGLGCYAGVHALRATAAGSLALPVSLVPLAAGLAGLAAAIPLGWASTRKSGTPFAMITLGLGELVAAAAQPTACGADRVTAPNVLALHGRTQGQELTRLETEGLAQGVGHLQGDGHRASRLVINAGDTQLMKSW